MKLKEDDTKEENFLSIFMNVSSSGRDYKDDSFFFGKIAFLIGILTLAFTLVEDKIPWNFIFPLVFFWLLPFFIVNIVEKRDNTSLGFRLSRDKVPRYIGYTVAGYMFLAFLILIEGFLRLRYANEDIYHLVTSHGQIVFRLLIQIMGIGLPEELFFRGYLMTRLSEWLGEDKGLGLSSLFFGAAHFLSRIVQHGPQYHASAFMTGFQTFLAGLVLGTQFRKTRSIIPPAISHILLNLTQPIILGFLL
ncbi:CPBP family intramembrane metalloprotease [Candidatus Bathyarchaeota archaeon]|nr:CPBP family intramembrane metalloprotease [Candidatus Bathyarchaeota archaeon]